MVFGAGRVGREHDNLFLVKIDGRQMNGNRLLQDYHFAARKSAVLGLGERRVPSANDRTFLGGMVVTRWYVDA
jgi:hypothetical protein